MRDLHLYSLGLPDELEHWIVPSGAIRRWDERALVCDIAIECGRMIRYYAFYDRWFQIIHHMDAAGRPVTKPGPIDWCFDIDICTPFFSVGMNGYDADLCLDVLAAPGGKPYIVKDEDDFAEAIDREWITETERRGALSGLEEINGIVAGGRLPAFLDEWCPFAVRPVPQPPMRMPSLSDHPLLERDRRGRFFGKRLHAFGDSGAVDSGCDR